MLQVDKVYKIFGKSPDKIIDKIKSSQEKDEDYDLEGHVLAVEDASFQLYQGEILVIMGLSGSGKSTLLRCVNRLTEPTCGKIKLELSDGEVDITKLNTKELRDLCSKKISMVFQDFSLLPFKTVTQNVAFGLKIQGIEKSTRIKKAMDTLEQVGLKEWGESMPYELSGGMQQRVGLARALATGANILLMDEPFSALDPLIRYNLQDELKRLQTLNKKSILFVSHDLGEALRIADRIVIMEKGKIVQIDVPEKIIINPLTEYVERFVETADATNTITAETLAKENHDIILDTEKRDKANYTYRDIKGNEIHYHIDSNGRLEKSRNIEGDIDLKRIDSKTSTNILENNNVAYTVNEKTTIREMIKLKQFSQLPIVVENYDNKFLGIITEKELFKGILKDIGKPNT